MEPHRLEAKARIVEPRQRAGDLRGDREGSLDAETRHPLVEGQNDWRRDADLVAVRPYELQIRRHAHRVCRGFVVLGRRDSVIDLDGGGGDRLPGRRDGQHQRKCEQGGEKQPLDPQAEAVHCKTRRPPMWAGKPLQKRGCGEPRTDNARQCRSQKVTGSGSRRYR